MNNTHTHSIRIATAVLALALSGGAFAQSAGTPTGNDPATAAAKNDSAQPVSDTWITTKVKTELLASSEVSGTDIKVETVNGVVKLSGTANKAQAEKAKSIAQNIDGVKSVDTSGLMAGAKSAKK
ncbi:Osmotically inducible protein Y precursor [Lysobacter capsici AZ78]|uniref:Osmotically inducible protein Y n=1 Tax=Lysobacter capsici AZ78 TaxID=1444315 RepID=A0A120AFH1_9GAMM|nr:BON domain-containing protein [Lysobacter capsici]KWS03005.1 Osmotically inducible protein Y precursor [Lysobacter capsici AZ78]